MKKILLLGSLLFLLSGCTGGEEVSCNINGKDAVFTLKDGVVKSYVLGGDNASQSKIDEINGEYFTSATNNDEGREALNRYIMSVGGTCN